MIPGEVKEFMQKNRIKQRFFLDFLVYIGLFEHVIKIHGIDDQRPGCLFGIERNIGDSFCRFIHSSVDCRENIGIKIVVFNALLYDPFNVLDGWIHDNLRFIQ